MTVTVIVVAGDPSLWREGGGEGGGGREGRIRLHADQLVGGVKGKGVSHKLSNVAYLLIRINTLLHQHF